MDILVNKISMRLMSEYVEGKPSEDEDWHTGHSWKIVGVNYQDFIIQGVGKSNKGKRYYFPAIVPLDKVFREVDYIEGS